MAKINNFDTDTASFVPKLFQKMGLRLIDVKNLCEQFCFPFQRDILKHLFFIPIEH